MWLRPELAVGDDVDDSIARPRWRQQVAGLAGDDDFARAVDVEADDWLARDQALRQHASETFPQAGVDDDVHRVDQFGDAAGWNESAEDEAIGKAEVGDVALELAAQEAVANEQELGIRVSLDDGRCGSDDVLLAFEVKQASDLADDDVVGLQAEFLSHDVSWSRRRQKRFDFHAAVDRHEFLARCDAGGDVLVGHGVAHADEFVAATSGPFLGEPVQLVSDRVLAVVE